MAKAFLSRYLHSLIDHSLLLGISGTYLPLSGGTITGDVVVSGYLTASSGLNLNNIVSLSAVSTNQIVIPFATNDLRINNWGLEVNDDKTLYVGLQTLYLEVASGYGFRFQLPSAGYAIAIQDVGPTCAQILSPAPNYVDIGDPTNYFASGYFNNLSAASVRGLSGYFNTVSAGSLVGVSLDYLPLSGGTVTGDVVVSGYITASSGLNLNNLVSLSASSTNQITIPFAGNDVRFYNGGIEVDDGKYFFNGLYSTYIEWRDHRHVFVTTAGNIFLSAIDANHAVLYTNGPDFYIGTDTYKITSGYFSNLKATSAYCNVISASDVTGLSGYFNTVSASDITGLSGYFNTVSAGSLVGVSLDYLPISGGTLTGGMSGTTISAASLTGLSGYFNTVSAGSLVGVSLDYLPISGGTLTGGMSGTSISAATVTGVSGYFGTVSATTYVGVETIPSAWSSYAATQEISATSAGMQMTSAWSITKDSEDSIVFTYNG